jgi:hypothetical protein
MGTKHLWVAAAPAVLLALAALAVAALACSDRMNELSTGAAPAGTTIVVPDIARDSATTPAPSSPPPAAPQPGPTDGPWNRDLWVAYSGDGLSFGEASRFVERAGVPCIIRDRGGRLVAVFQWFPFDDEEAFDQVAVAFSEDGGTTWSSPAKVTVAGMPANLMRPFDPTLVQLEDGRYRLYFTSNEHTGGGRPAIYSAVSNDGVAYTFEPGARFAPAAGTVDASVVRFGSAWHLFSHTMEANTGRGFHAVSSDGLSFEELPMVDAGSGRQWIGNAVVQGGSLRYYGSGRDGVWSATSTDGGAWTLDAGTRLSGGDPSAVVMNNGEVMLVHVGGPRDDAGPNPFRNPPP